MSIASRLHSDERGVSAVVVGVSVFALFGALLLSVDAGNLWQERRNIITATDATALSEARAAALAPAQSACTSQWSALLATNAGPTVTPLECSFTRQGQASGYVTVRAEKPVTARFGGVFNLGTGSAYSLSAARFTVANNVEGLRPIGFCLQNSHVQEWLAHVNAGTPLPAPGSLNHPTGYPGAVGPVHRVWWEKQFQDGACGTVTGNWGWMDFNGGSNSNAQLVTWIREGYRENAVAVGDCNDDNARPAEPCDGDTGVSGGSVSSALDSILGQPISVVVYGSAVGNGSGADFTVVGFLGVKLWGYQVTGAASQRYFDMEFTRILAEPGTRCCTPTAPDFGARVVRLCAVDHDSQSIGSRCS